MTQVNFNSRDPIYLQVIDHFRERLVGDELVLGAELPSRRQIARQLGINPNTVQRAFSEMEEQKWIYTEPNRPSRVTENPATIQKLKKEFVEEAVKEFVASIQTIDITYEEVSELIANEIKKQSTKNGGTQDD
ncbi:DNA-binding transcriptional regulator YhcF, GntR family [Atopostipes suicloacalis DSM 15692]|uniref:DNA-binding transcriptional regulator YhcF, GntR family n=1 Tax=Atopostipes suicloacalis DSM 15692 TaxID=1121025 RepID=A0A1M4VCZ2_9LACT|nr:GntR family transcriptional regulator [Atopostipes suicloacalis]SHE66852.1 DNA-binding transcriptional regulator YhcF, GntR family [Atopostipes suicloacalis DSM 15692]